MIQTVRERLHAMNAEKIAEQNRPKVLVYTRLADILEIQDIAFGEMSDDIAETISTDIPTAQYIGDSTDIFDADSEDIADYIAMFYPYVYATFDADNPAYD
jgi:hypothetical protein